MKLLTRLAMALAMVFAAAAVLPAFADTAPAGTPHLMLQLKDGAVDIELAPKIAPGHVERIVTLTKQGFYNGLKFHRVIAGFMAQTGDPKGDGTGGSTLPDLKAEFSSTPFDRGTLGMARASDPDSANSQFFIMLAPGAFLNGQYTAFGKVVSGMQFVDNIKKGDQADNGSVSDPDKIVAATIVYK
jgi:peptidylprolyl isomerase